LDEKWLQFFCPLIFLSKSSPQIWFWLGRVRISDFRLRFIELKRFVRDLKKEGKLKICSEFRKNEIGKIQNRQAGAVF
jgi:hypothetical protein